MEVGSRYAIDTKLYSDFYTISFQEHKKKKHSYDKEKLTDSFERCCIQKMKIYLKSKSDHHLKISVDRMFDSYKDISKKKL